MGSQSQPRPRRRDEALAFIIDRLVQDGSSPTYVEIGDRLGVGKTRAQELVEQLIVAGVIEKVPGTQRALRVRDVVQARRIVAEFAHRLGWAVAAPLGPLEQPVEPLSIPKTCPHVQLPRLSAFEHLPEPE